MARLITDIDLDTAGWLSTLAGNVKDYLQNLCIRLFSTTEPSDTQKTGNSVDLSTQSNEGKYSRQKKAITGHPSERKEQKCNRGTGGC